MPCLEVKNLPLAKLDHTSQRSQVRRIVAARLHKVLGIATSFDGHDITLHATSDPATVDARFMLEPHHSTRNGRPVEPIKKLKAGVVFKMQLRCIDGSTILRRITFTQLESMATARQNDAGLPGPEAPSRSAKRPSMPPPIDTAVQRNHTRLCLQVPDVPMSQICGGIADQSTLEHDVRYIIALKLYRELGINTGRGDTIELLATDVPGCVTARFQLLPAHDFRKGRLVENLHKLKQGTPFNVTLNSSDGRMQFVRQITLVEEISASERLGRRDKRQRSAGTASAS